MHTYYFLDKLPEKELDQKIQIKMGFENFFLISSRLFKVTFKINHRIFKVAQFWEPKDRECELESH